MARAELSQEELDLRKNGIGASEIAAIVGLNPFGSPLKIWKEKTGKVERRSSSRSEMGQRMEPVIAEWYCERENVQSWQKPKTMVHPKFDWAMATPDLICQFPSGKTKRAEIKLVGWKVRKHWRQGPPPYVVAQVLWQGWVSGIEDCDLAVWFGTEDEDQLVYRIPYMPDVAEMLHEIGLAFWQDYVLTNTPPPIDASEEWGKYLLEKFPRHEKPMLVAPDEAEQWVRQWSVSREMMAEAVLLESESVHHLQQLIGAHEGMEDPGGQFRVTWKTDAAGAPRWKAIAEELGVVTPELLAKHTNRPARRFLVHCMERP
jgi:putative phage-type endonuclease